MKNDPPHVFTWNPSDGDAKSMEKYRDAAVESYPPGHRPRRVEMAPNGHVPLGKCFLLEPFEAFDHGGSGQ